MNKRVFLFFILLFAPSLAWGVDTKLLPDIAVNVGGNSIAGDGSISASLKIVILVTLLTFAPAIVMTSTCFTRIAVVLSMTRTALGTQQLPPNQVLTGLALFMTIAVMNPVFSKMYIDGIKPFFDGQMAEDEALKKTLAPLTTFLVRHSRQQDIALFTQITKTPQPKDPSDVPFHVAVPAFVMSELTAAFKIGFLIALPFLVLDMVVSSVLTAMSMITLPPVVISLPLKMMLFVVVDGWNLIILSLIQSYKV